MTHMQCCCGEAPATGACCKLDGSCVVTDAVDCAGMAGTYLGDGEACSPSDRCEGACCDIVTGGCTDVGIGFCTGINKSFNGFGTKCSSVTCESNAKDCCSLSRRCFRIASTGAHSLRTIHEYDVYWWEPECSGTPWPGSATQFCSRVTRDETQIKSESAAGCASSFLVNNFIDVVGPALGACPPCPDRDHFTTGSIVNASHALIASTPQSSLSVLMVGFSENRDSGVRVFPSCNYASTEFSGADFDPCTSPACDQSNRIRNWFVRASSSHSSLRDCGVDGGPPPPVAALLGAGLGLLAGLAWQIDDSGLAFLATALVPIPGMILSVGEQRQTFASGHEIIRRRAEYKPENDRAREALRRMGEAARIRESIEVSRTKRRVVRRCGGCAGKHRADLRRGVALDA